jgi:putative spermidine/putrescine transport system permease protein
LQSKKLEWGYFLLIPGIGYIVFFIVIALYVMVAQSVGYYNYTGVSEFTLRFWKEVFNQSFFDDLWFSFRTAFLTALISIILCYPLSLFVQKMPGKNLFLSVMKIPLFIPGLVASFLILNIIDYQGILNQVLLALHFIEKPLRLRNDPAGIGALTVQIWKNIPFQMMIMYAAIENIRTDIKEAAQNLGANRRALLTQIIIPISLPSAFVAVIMVFIQTFNDFAIARTAGPLYPTSISNLMYLRSYTFGEWNAAACIGVMMMLTSILFVIVYTAVFRKIIKHF